MNFLDLLKATADWKSILLFLNSSKIFLVSSDDWREDREQKEKLHNSKRKKERRVKIKKEK